MLSPLRSRSRPAAHAPDTCHAPSGPGRARLLGAGTVLALVLGLVAGCSSDEETPDADQEPVVAAPATSPLTGLEVPGDGPRHPVLAVKIDNSSSSAPQVGLGSADLVVEELVEGGITRLAAFFYSTVPADVGPVRSMRATDIGIVLPLAAAMVSSGGAPQTVARVRDAGIEVFTEGSRGFYRESSRSAPYNLFNRLGQLARVVRATEKPVDYLPFDAAAELPAGRRARGLTATFSPASSTTFAFSDGAWSNTDSHAAEGDRFRPDTVLVLRVRVGDAGYLDPAGNPVPETLFTGQGAAQVFHDGRVVAGRWSKAGLDAPVALTTRDGGDLRLPPGKVWIELVPADGGSVTVTR